MRPWVKTVCKNFQKMTKSPLARTDLKPSFLSPVTIMIGALTIKVSFSDEFLIWNLSFDAQD